MRSFPIYATTYKGVELCLIQAAIGSASIAMMTDYLIGYGVRSMIACGGCGVLRDIPAGDVIIPVTALRDEGASYHYLPPAREIGLDADVIGIIRLTLAQNHVPFVECKTWTTDAFYRETPDMITYRREEGCAVVEMECATMASVARFRGAKFGQLLYSGDILVDYEKYDERCWALNVTARERIFYLAMEAAASVADDV
jgi:uridine phosphorylase